MVFLYVYYDLCTLYLLFIAHEDSMRTAKYFFKNKFAIYYLFYSYHFFSIKAYKEVALKFCADVVGILNFMLLEFFFLEVRE